MPESGKHTVEIEYGLEPKGYGSTLEIEHIVSLELGGSNDIASLYPDVAALRNKGHGFHVKDKLENKVHDLVCDGTIGAAYWQALYKRYSGRSDGLTCRAQLLVVRCPNAGAM